MVRHLRSPEAEEREAALHELFGNIFHQGTRYEASAYGVPFLLELVADPATPDRHEIIYLITCLAIGQPGPLAATGFPVDELRLAGTDAEIKAYDAVLQGVPLLLRLLDDTDTELAGRAVHALAWFPKRAATIVPALARLGGQAGSPRKLACAAIVTLGILLHGTETHDHDALLSAHLSGDDEALSWSAAIAFAHIAGSGSPEAVASELSEYALDLDDRTPHPVWEISRPELSLRMLGLVNPGKAEAILTMNVTAQLDRPMEANWHNHVIGPLGRVFGLPDREHGKRFGELTLSQRAVIYWLIARPEAFAGNGLEFALRMYGLPTTHEALRSYAED